MANKITSSEKKGYGDRATRKREAKKLRRVNDKKEVRNGMG